MKNSELPLYLKISPIYNKILQLGIAVLCIVVLLNTLVFSQKKQESIISEHFTNVSQVQLQQAVIGIKALLTNAGKITAVNSNKENIAHYINHLSTLETINDVHFYDANGLLIASSTGSVNIKTLYGLGDSKENKGDTFITFVEEIRTDKLIGYLRFTTNKKQVVKPLFNASFDVHETMRLLILFSLVIGFLLTRGFSRFSRQGFRITK